VPIYVEVSNKNFEPSKAFKKQCAIRFDFLGCELPELEALVVPGPPPLIAHSSPCAAFSLFKKLSSNDCPFIAHITDVTIADSVGAGVTMKYNTSVLTEVAIGGSVRDVTRKGRVDARAWLKCGMRVEGPLEGLLAYCAFKSLEQVKFLPPGLYEWSCHEGRYGVKGDHLVFWEYVEL